MNNRLSSLVRRCLNGAVQNSELNVLSSGERAYVALAANKYELLDDPVCAWHQLSGQWQRAVCDWRGWPTDWACEDTFSFKSDDA